MTATERIEEKRQQIEKCKERMNKEQERIKKLTKEIEEIESVEVKGMLKELNMPLDDLKKFLKGLKETKQVTAEENTHEQNN